MGKTDVAMKEWLEIPEVFAELFNGAVFNGKRLIDANNLAERNSEYVLSMKSRDGKEEYKQKFRDVVKMNNSELGLVVLAVENQADVCNIMPVRGMMYDAMAYEKNIRDIINQNEKEKKKVPVTKVIEKGQKLMPVVTLVLYTGADEWDGPTCLHEMWNIPEETKELLKNELNDYKVHIIDANHMTEEEIEKYSDDVGKFFLVLHMLNQNKSLKEAEDLTVKYSKTARAIGVVRNRNLYDTLINKEEGEVDMRQIEDDWFEAGERSGEERGEQKKLIGMVCKKLNKNKSPEVIADELEEELDLITNICSVAEKIGTDYDVESIYQTLHEDTEYGE